MHNKLSLLALVSFLLLASQALATDPASVLPTPPEAPLPKAKPMTLVFSDDFSANPNSSGKWTCFRRQNDLNNEGAYNSTEQCWDLTHNKVNLALAAFANYELKSHVWKAQFRYRQVGNKGDGFVFMFYKDKSAYGVPDSGTYMGFETRDIAGHTFPVSGYGLKFDLYEYSGCDELNVDYIALIHDAVCNTAFGYRPDSRVGDGQWHTVVLSFTDGRIQLQIDNETLWYAGLSDSCNGGYDAFSGVGFGAGTGSYWSTQSIDDFQLWVGDE